MSKKNDTTNPNVTPLTSNARRQVLTGVALGAAALATSRTAKAAAPNQESIKAMPSLKNPMDIYPHPPFEKQLQPFPGLQSKMHPIPDCGEKSYQGSGRLKGRHALITGGDSGIGRAVAIACAREGADVAINYLPEEESDAKEVIELIKKAGQKAVALPGDIRSEEFCKKLVSDAAAQLGGLDLLINVAGRQKFNKDLLTLSTEDFDWTIKTNIYALFWITKAAIPHMPPGSSIINTASKNSYDPSDILIDYSLTKAAISNFTKSLAKQILHKGIRVNAVEPGPFWTPLQVCGGQSQENVHTFGEDTPYKRPGQPAEIASVYITLASTEGSYITGQNWGITGGTGFPG